MKERDELIGKTIADVMAVPVEEGGPLKIWMLQFTDGSHVEFVSPGAQRELERLARRRGRASNRSANAGTRASLAHPQLALAVA